MNLALVASHSLPSSPVRAARTHARSRLRLCASSSRTTRAAARLQPVAVAPETVLRKVWAVGEPHRRQHLQNAPSSTPQPATDNQQPHGLAFYRKYTEAMLRRYLRMSTDAGRVPSLLGRELFRARVSSYRMQSFEDVVIFCLDVERCLARLEREEQQLIKRITLQEYSQGEAAMLLNLSLRDTVRKYSAALDHLTGIFLETGLMNELKH